MIVHIWPSSTEEDIANNFSGHFSPEYEYCRPEDAANAKVFLEEFFDTLLLKHPKDIVQEGLIVDDPDEIQIVEQEQDEEDEGPGEGSSMPVVKKAKVVKGSKRFLINDDQVSRNLNSSFSEDL